MRLNRYTCLLLCFILGMAWSCTGKKNGSSQIPIEDFFEKPDKSSFKLSPDGKQLAYIGMDEHCRNIFVLHLEDARLSKQLTYQDHMNVQYFFWANNDTLVYRSEEHTSELQSRINLLCRLLCD